MLYFICCFKEHCMKIKLFICDFMIKLWCLTTEHTVFSAGKSDITLFTLFFSNAHTTYTSHPKCIICTDSIRSLMNCVKVSMNCEDVKSFLSGSNREALELCLSRNYDSSKKWVCYGDLNRVLLWHGNSEWEFAVVIQCVSLTW